MHTARFHIDELNTYAFCIRKWALTRQTMPSAYDIPTLTLPGTPYLNEATTVYCPNLSITGICDMLLLYKKDGITFPHLFGTFQLMPVLPPSSELLIASYTLCIEEMYACTIDYVFIQSSSATKHIEQPVSPAVKNEANHLWQQMHTLLNRQHIPTVKIKKHCVHCHFHTTCKDANSPMGRADIRV